VTLSLTSNSFRAPLRQANKEEIRLRRSVSHVVKSDTAEGPTNFCFVGALASVSVSDIRDV